MDSKYGQAMIKFMDSAKVYAEACIREGKSFKEAMETFWMEMEIPEDATPETKADLYKFGGAVIQYTYNC